MPLKKLKAVWETHGHFIETGIWIAVFAVAYILMMKVMHPGWTFFGI